MTSATGIADAPYWSEATSGIDAIPDATPPATADVVVIGSGYTGLSAALQTARGGRDTVIVEAGTPGMGCSTRNGAHIGTSIKPGLDALTRTYGRERAQAIRGEGQSALDWIKDFTQTEKIDCDFRLSGRFHGAHCPKAYEAIAREAEHSNRQEDTGAYVVSRADQRRDIGSDFYHGGVVYPNVATLHPAKYHHGLMIRATEAGATLIGNCPATEIDREGDRFRVTTPKGTIRTRDVVVATNGYTTGLTPWLQRRVIPIGSYVIATDPLPRDMIKGLFPSGRLVVDTRKVVYYFGPSPDGQRVIFGGRVSTGETDPSISGPRLHADMAQIFPELSDVGISHSWTGFVAYTFDELPHIGTHDGVQYAMGYCGTGVSLSGYLGMRLGQKVLGHSDGKTAFDDLPFPTRPFYRGKPWFLPAALAWYRWRDRVETRQAGR